MKANITQSDFIHGFSESRKDQFSYNALAAIYNYLIEYEDSTGEELEFDPIAICCDFCEYDSAWGAMQQYQPKNMPTIDDSEGMDLEELGEAQEEAALEWLQDNTQVIEFDGGIVVQNF